MKAQSLAMGMKADLKPIVCGLCFSLLQQVSLEACEAVTEWKRSQRSWLLWLMLLLLRVARARYLVQYL